MSSHPYLLDHLVADHQRSLQAAAAADRLGRNRPVFARPAASLRSLIGELLHWLRPAPEAAREAANTSGPAQVASTTLGRNAQT